MLHTRAFRYGVEVRQEDPIYSSVIGRVKFTQIYKVSTHNAATIVIARRHFRFSERLSHCWDNIPDNKGHL